MLTGKNNKTSFNNEYLITKTYLNLYFGSFAFRFDFVLRLETISKDSSLVFPLIGADEHLLNNVTDNVIMSAKTSPKNTSFKSKYLEEFKEIPKEYIAAILKRYSLDLELFGYKFDPKTLTTSCQIQTEDGDYCC